MRSIMAMSLVVSTSAVDLLTFDGSETAIGWSALVDPVMGGKSVATATVDEEGQFGILDGEVKIVPALSAPGFITAFAQSRTKFADASSAAGGDLVLNVRSNTSDYKGFKVSFASGTLSPQFSCASGGSTPGSRGCFKANFNVPAGDDFTAVRVPFSSFSDKWSSATGEHTVECADDASACVTADTLKQLQRIEIWGEGTAGVVHIEVKSISAEPAAVVV
jgi:hypothetical protein